MPERHTYIIEFVRVGRQVKVTACDPETGMEAVIVGPTNASKKHLTDTAVRKLQYQLQKESGEEL